MHENDAPKERFSNRAAFYVRYRPSYPTAVITHLQTHCNLTPDSIIADIGSGTGLLAQLFLQNGNTVYGVEPNQVMREAGGGFLAALRRVFEEYKENGRVLFQFVTKLYVAKRP